MNMINSTLDGRKAKVYRMLHWMIGFGDVENQQKIINTTVHKFINIFVPFYFKENQNKFTTVILFLLTTKLNAIQKIFNPQFGSEM